MHVCVRVCMLIVSDFLIPHGMQPAVEMCMLYEQHSWKYS